jgi:hypothetical protein
MNSGWLNKRIASLCMAAACTQWPLGCASTPGECNPKEVDFFKNTSCLVSGAYGERKRGLESDLAAEQARNKAFRSVLAELQVEQVETRMTVHAREQAYARLDTAWRSLKQNLAGQMKRSRTLAARVRQIDGTVSARKASDPRAGVAQRRAVRDDLSRQITLLERELDAGVHH